MNADNCKCQNRFKLRLVGLASKLWAGIVPFAVVLPLAA